MVERWLETASPKLSVSVGDNVGTSQRGVLELFTRICDLSPFICPLCRCSSRVILTEWPLWDPCLLGEAMQEVRGAGTLFSFTGSEGRGFGPLLPHAHHLLEMVLDYSNLDLSKIGTLKWRLEERRLDFFFPPEILNASKTELFELMNCLKQWGVSPFVLALQN